MNSWKTWTLQTWNERLLAHFFRRRDEQSSAVVVLLVTADELARATADPSANADDVRSAFVGAVRAAIRHSRSLLDDASNYYGWPGPPSWEAPPRFVAHLLFTCIAASESSDELGDEGSFVSRLRDLTHDQLPEHSLQTLPRLWEHLAAWLGANERMYRVLYLPDPGGLTRIGYTVKLAFPDRRDQRQLSDLLDRAGLAGHEPPVGRVMSLVASERSRFRRPFLDAFQEFRRLFEKSSVQSTRRLVEHRFWAAVREASLRGRGQAGLLDLSICVSLLCEEQDDRLIPFVVADQRTESAEFSFLELPVAYGDWQFALVPSGIDTLEGEQLERVTRAALAGRFRLPRVSSHVEQGLLPFVIGSHGLLELAAHDQLGDVTVALVRVELITDFLRFFGYGASTRPSPYAGWVQVHGVALRSVPFQELDGTLLDRTWLLHEALLPTSIRVAGGVRADDGWLGAREVLPRIATPRASSVVLEGPDGREALTRIDDDNWALPRRDITGEFTLLASIEGDTQARRTIRFHAAPASEDFKACAEPDAWILEGMGGTVTLSESTPFAALSGDRDYRESCERMAHLGADVGLFVTSSQDAAWNVTHFAGRVIGARGPHRGDALLPANQIANAHARRRWRKMLFESAPSWSDPGFEQARRQVKWGAPSHANLPKIDVDQTVPDLAPLPLPAPLDAVDRLVRIVSGRASTRAGLDWRDWAELGKRVLGVDARQFGHVTRAWMEAGLIDTASYARWWHRSVFARKPFLVGFRAGDYVGATLTGLALPKTRDELQRAAMRVGALVEERLSVSHLVPRSLSLRLPGAQELEDLGRVCRLDVYWLDLEPLARGTLSRHDGASAPPSHYEGVSRWSQWSLAGEHPGLEVEHRMRRDRPDFWVVSRGDKCAWSYDLNVVRSWGATLLEAPVVNAVGDAFIEANHAYLPLPLARAVGIIGAGLAGPTPNGTYRYPIGFAPLQKRALDIVARTFDPSRLAATATARQATG